MQLTKFDIGAEILAILTKGMYPDPRDAVREYIQNSIDAKAANVTVKVRQNSVVIEDDGVGMDYTTLRKAVRLGVSDKRPGKDIGFMGIGIYSAFRLCDTLSIYTRKKGQLPQILSMNFKGMKDLLETEKEKRLNGEIGSDDMTDLQTLLQTHIEIPEENTVSEDEYPIQGSGTRVELVGLDRELDDFLNKYDALSDYLQNVVPLKFDRNNFKWAELIENKIRQVCETHNAVFELINLKLQVGSKLENLYRPYKDSEFNFNTPQEPIFKEIEANGDFFGIAWGCLNSYDNSPGKRVTRIANKNLRGFLLKKQGFSIGTRDDIAPYFSQSNTHFDRFTGEIIIVNRQLLPNAARNNFEASSLRSILFKQIKLDVAPYYNGKGDKYQEEQKAKDELLISGNQLKRILAETNPNEDNPNTLLRQIGDLDKIKSSLEKRLKKYSEEDKKEVNNIIQASEKLRRETLLRFDQLTSKKKSRKFSTPLKDTKTEIADSVKNYTADEVTIKFETLLDLTNHLEIDYNDEMKQLLELIDAKFIQSMATTKTNYFQLLLDLKNDFENQ